MFGIALIAFAGFAALCLAMPKHFEALLGRTPRPGQLRMLQVTGWLMLLMSLAVGVQSRGWAHGLVEWTAVAMAGVTLWAFGLAYLPRLLVGVAALGAVLGPLLVLFAR